ncbi:MAG: ribosomal protein [Nitrospirae bacterium]|jgi:large subunit ribosomal protein L21|nr:ribosomal protein [Nitrospirota bacterium]
MYAIIDTGGFQQKVALGDTVRVQKIASAAGTSVIFENVLLVSNDDRILIGSPYVKNASVKAELLDDEKGKKVIIFKKKPRKGHKKTIGHRQQYSLVTVKDIVVGG